MIINSKAPNPFELFNDEECCYVVRDLQTETVTPKQKYSLKKTRLCGPWYATLKQIIKTDITKQQFFDNFSMITYSYKGYYIGPCHTQGTSRKKF